MKKTFQKTLIAAAAGVALMSAAGTASANSLLFPYFKIGSAVQSVISLSNAGTTATTEAIHYSYGVTTACTHYDNWGRLTANDIISHSVAAPAIGGVGVLPANDTSLPGYLSVTPGTATWSQEGFVIVSNVGSASTNALRGSMAVIEASSGLFLSYAGIDNMSNTKSTASDASPNFGKYSNTADASALEGNFSLGLLNTAGQGPSAVAPYFQMTWLPTATVSTSWWALAIGNMNSFTRGTAQTWGGTFSMTNGQNNVWDNDENFVSGTAGTTAACLGTFSSKALQTANQQAAYVSDPVMSKGGGSGLYKGTSTIAGTGADNVILMKLQNVTSGDKAYDRGTLMHREVGSIVAF